MTQLEAVQQIRDWLPPEAIFNHADAKEAKTVRGLWKTVSEWYTSLVLSADYSRLYHFSQFNCLSHTMVFKENDCICIKVSQKEKVIYMVKHLPYQVSHPK